MVFHNTPGGYNPIEPKDERVLNSTYFRDKAPPKEDGGLYSRTDIPVDKAGLESGLLDGAATILDYQYWAETAWKEEHGTFPAVERFSTKLREECGELAMASIRVENQGLTTQNQEEFKKECGDVLWCATALASCAGADIDSGLKNLLFRYLMGTQRRDAETGQLVAPIWRPKASELATKYDQLTIRDIDSLVDEHFEP